ncbi:hypothetical protein [Catenovulum sediminis]|uniref:DUF721 domain-containing protein n=1 Tax=Catenovulum sediminis TaxID=1740262 RepID=A0ABV1RG38_9ALTE|nr:hypothetical protein [Catenovulum sediminis]
MRPRPKNVQQILSEKWPERQTSSQIKPEYTSEIEKELALCLPSNLQNVVKVVKFDKGMLQLSLPNASYQMQFVAIRSELLSKLRQKQPQLISLKCIVDPTQPVARATITSSLATSKSAAKPSRTLSQKSKHDLAAILPDLPEEVKKALKHLIDGA